MATVCPSAAGHFLLVLHSEYPTLKAEPWSPLVAQSRSAAQFRSGSPSATE